MAIPKRIHYCWFGSREGQSRLVRKCIASWKKLQGYEIIEWNEHNIDSGGNAYFDECIAKRRYAFASDFVRLKVLSDMGGIYLDTDVEIRKPYPDSVLDFRMFIPFMFDCTLSTAVIGCEAHCTPIEDLLRIYDKLKYNGSTNNGLITNYFLSTYKDFRLNNSLQVLDGDIAIFPKEYFECPTFKKDSGFSVHYSEGSWHPHNGKLTTLIRSVIKLGASTLVGEVAYTKFRRYQSLRISPFYPTYLQHARPWSTSQPATF